MSEFRQESLGCAAGDKYGPWCGKDLEHDDSKNTVAYFGERAAPTLGEVTAGTASLSR